MTTAVQQPSSTSTCQAALHAQLPCALLNSGPAAAVTCTAEPDGVGGNNRCAGCVTNPAGPQQKRAHRQLPLTCSSLQLFVTLLRANFKTRTWGQPRVVHPDWDFLKKACGMLECNRVACFSDTQDPHPQQQWVTWDEASKLHGLLWQHTSQGQHTNTPCTWCTSRVWSSISSASNVGSPPCHLTLKPQGLLYECIIAAQTWLWHRESQSCTYVPHGWLGGIQTHSTMALCAFSLRAGGAHELAYGKPRA